MKDNVRVRFAPSPTGEPHVGNLRTALFNWLFARRYGGKFVLRVEDTDRERYVEGALDAILDSLRWLRLDWDEGPGVEGPYGPYFQSQRLPIYQETAEQLIHSGHAYHCYCSRDRLQNLRLEQQKRGAATGYDRRCRDGSAVSKTDRSDVPVVRFKMPLSGETSIDDLIRDEVTWQNGLLDDFILLKSDGYPTYHLANVVDDHLMEITHVLRAEEWLPSTPRHLQLYTALGYDPPFFAHLPMILGPDRDKLSKRHGATSIIEYRDGGYLPEAMVNFMVLLGWSLDDKTDIISRDSLVENFSLKRVGKAGAIFDHDKLLWVNGVYIRQLSREELVQGMGAVLQGRIPDGTGEVDQEYLGRIAPLVQERLRSFGEVPEITSYFFQDAIEYDPGLLVQKGVDSNATIGALRRAHEALSGLKVFDSASVEETLRATGAELGLSGRQLFGALRVAVTGRSSAPPLFETMDVLGRERCLDRIEAAARKLAENK